MAGLDGHHTVDLYCGDHESLWWEEGGRGVGWLKGGDKERWGRGEWRGWKRGGRDGGEGGRSEKGEVIK